MVKVLIVGRHYEDCHYRDGLGIIKSKARKGPECKIFPDIAKKVVDFVNPQFIGGNMFEIKVKHTWEIGKAWEDLPVREVIQRPEARCNELAQAADVHEVRWNREGSQQGHYVYGKGHPYAV